MASAGNDPDPCEMAKTANIPERAPVGPTMLKLLPPKIDASNPAQMAVMIPISGVAPAATASEMDRGMETKDTVMPDFQLFFKLMAKEPSSFFIIIKHTPVVLLFQEIVQLTL